MKTASISKHLGSFIVIGVMLITAPATVAFAGRIFGWVDLWSALRSGLLIFVTEIAALAWHRATKSLARGETQHSIAGTMTWVSLAGVVCMAGIEISLEFAAKSRALGDISSTLSVVGIVALVVLMALNLGSGVAFMNNDPDYVQRRNEEKINEATQEVQNELNERTIEAIKRQMLQRKDELIQPRIAANLEAMMNRQLMLAAQEAKKLLNEIGDVIEGTAKPVEKNPTVVFPKEASENVGNTTPKP